MIGCFLTRLNKFERLLMFIGGLLMIDPGTLTDIIGIIILGGVFVLQRRKKKAEQR